MMCGLVGWRALWLILVTKFYQPFANLGKVERSAWSRVINFAVTLS